MSAEGMIGGDICQLGLQPDYINVTCSVNYKGNIDPTLAWGDVPGDILSHSTSHVMFGHNHMRVTSILIVQANEGLNGSTFACSAKMIWDSNGPAPQKSTQDLNITWRTPDISLLCKYFIVNI